MRPVPGGGVRDPAQRAGQVVVLPAPLNTGLFRWGFTPLIEAQRFEHSAVVEFLLDWLQERLPEQLQQSLQILSQMETSERQRK